MLTYRGMMKFDIDKKQYYPYKNTETDWFCVVTIEERKKILLLKQKYILLSSIPDIEKVKYKPLQSKNSPFNTEFSLDEKIMEQEISINKLQEII